MSKGAESGTISESWASARVRHSVDSLPVKKSSISQYLWINE